MGTHSPAVATVSGPLDAYLRLRSQWAHDPEKYVRQRLGQNPTWQQRQMLEAIAPEGAKVSVRSGHGVGKTAAESGALWWFLETRDFPKIPCTAPTAHQLHDVLWAETKKWMRKSYQASRKWGCPDHLQLANLFQITRERIYTPDAREEWYAVARTSGRDNPDALQGFHATDLEIDDEGTGIARGDGGAGHIMFLIEEASGIVEEVFEVAEGALSSPGARMLMVGNPTRTTGYFADSHRSRRSAFTTLHFRTDDSPLADPDYRPRLVRKWGEGSNIVKVRADGEFPSQEDDVLISIEDTEAALTRSPYEPAPGLERRLGVDVARFGDDRVTYVLRQGRNVIRVAVRARQRTTATIGEVREFAREWQADAIFVDEVGLGAGVVDGLIEHDELSEKVVGVNVAESAPAREDEYAQGKTKRDHLWLEGARWIEEEVPSFFQASRENPDAAEDLAGELATPRYEHDSSGRIVVESKQAMKKRGMPSPDLADGLLLTFDQFTPEGAGIAAAGRRRF